MIERECGDACYMQFGQYDQFPELIHGIFTRRGGYSQPPYASLNVSLSSGNERYEDAVRNRFLALQCLDIAEYPCATMWMIHSAHVLTLDGQDWPDWGAHWPHSVYELDTLGYPPGTKLQWTFKPRTRADAIITRKRGVALTMSTADCVPLLFYDPVTEAIGVAHAGWRGTARGIAAATVDAMCEQFGARPSDIHAGVGPSIGPCCYEVSDEVQQLFLGQRAFEELPTEERYRQLVAESAVFEMVTLPEKESLRLNLWETNRNQLLLAGLDREHIELPEVCTSCAKEHFFSHRADQGLTGRFPAILALRA
ncbi:MAG TPA: peptidoglycan editing factor PgeF [Ktedonobacteraceae bacterium]|nr:peptidoglycan editing factor PgeF [Ktedonobacteraceae bacterium]